MAASRNYASGDIARVSQESPRLRGEEVEVLASVYYMQTDELWVRPRGGVPTLLSERLLNLFSLPREKSEMTETATRDRFAEAVADYALWLGCDQNYLPLQDAIGEAVHAYCGTLTADIISVAEGGVGTGLTTERLLAADPRIGIFASDINEAFAHGTAVRIKQMFPGRNLLMTSRPIQRDISILAGLRIFASGLMIHNMSPADREELFTVLGTQLAPGGLFVSGDKIIPDDEAAYDALFQPWMAQLKFFKEVGRPDLYEMWHRHEMEDRANPLRESDQIALLEKNGFIDIRIPKRFGMYALVTARKP